MRENEVITVYEIYADDGYLYGSWGSLEVANENARNLRNVRIEKNTYIFHENEPWELLDIEIEEEG